MEQQKTVFSTTDLVIVTGVSGAGKTQALKVLKDLDYDVVDNLPLPLLLDFLNEEFSEKRRCALGIDVTTKGFSSDRLIHILAEFEQRTGVKAILMFLDCQDEVLTRRFIETRFKHPLAHNRPVQQGLEQERSILEPLQERADIVLDTSDFSLSDLKHHLKARFSITSCPKIAVNILSFSFKKGIPREADLVFDVRFLKNPHWNIELRPLTGENKVVKDFIYEDPNYSLFFNRLQDMITFLLPTYEREGKSYLTIAIGCTGGKHRSVCIAEDLAEVLKQKGWSLMVVHKNLLALA